MVLPQIQKEYKMTTPNMNAKTGISFGYINANDINSEVLDTIFCNGVDLDRLGAEIDFAKRFGFIEMTQNEDELFPVYLGRVQDALLDFLNSVDDEDPDFMAKVEEHDRNMEEYTGNIHVMTYDDTTVIYNTDTNLLCVMDSPHVGKYYACSPCCPNAGDLNSAGGDVDTYDVPAEWRDLDY